MKERLTNILFILVYASLLYPTIIVLPNTSIAYHFTRLMQLVNVATFLYFAYKHIISKNKPNTFSVIIHLFWLFMVITTVINTSPLTYNVIYQWMVIGTFILLIDLYWNNKYNDHLRYLSVVLSFVVYLNSILIVLFPEGLWVDEGWLTEGDKNRYLFGNYNQTGIVSLLAILIQGLYTIRTDKSKLNMYLLMIVSVAIVAYMGSATSTVGLILTSGFFIANKFIKNISPYVIAFFAFYILFFILFVWGNNSVYTYTKIRYFIEEVLHKDISFTGRQPLWIASKQLFYKSPIIGHGVQDFMWMIHHIDGSGPHNLLLMILLEGGLIGLGIFLFIVVKSIVSALIAKSKECNWAVVSVCILLLMSLFETYRYILIFVMIIIMQQTSNRKIVLNNA